MTPKDLSGLTLRRALAEALGGKLWNYDDNRYAESDDDYADAFNNDGWTWQDLYESGEAHEWKPESDATLSEELLDRECRRRKLRWELYQSALGPPDSYYCSIHSASEIVIAEGWGETPSEARARALLR